MSAEIVPLAESHFEGVRRALDIVAREKRYLAFIQAPPPERAYAFYRNILTNNCRVPRSLSWTAWLSVECDILPTHGETRAHIGILGMGLVPSARGRGIGQTLMQTTLAKAWAKGLSRIELTVRTDNLNAKALYDRMGFKTEGLNQRALVDGKFYDTYAMALLR